MAGESSQENEMSTTVTLPKTLKLANDDSLQMRIQGVSMGERPEMSPPSSNISGDDDDDDSRDPFGVVESIMGVNRMLEKQIDALRLRVHVEAKHHAIEKSKIIGEKDNVITKKTAEIEELKETVQQRDDRISSLQKEAANRSTVIGDKSKEIDTLRELIKQAEDYTRRLHRHSDSMRGERGFSNREDLVKYQKDELNRLKEELSTLKQKVTVLEKELLNARNVIELQGKKIDQFESEKNGLSLKFQEQLEKATRAMRQEVERMREVMKSQWEEMKSLREQNQDIHDDVKMIRTLLVDQVSARDRNAIGTPKTTSRTNDDSLEAENKPVGRYKIDEHQQYVLGSNQNQALGDKPNTAVPMKSRFPVNRPTVASSPRVSVSPTRSHHPVTRSSSIKSGRNRQSIEANLPPIQNVQKSATTMHSGGDPFATAGSTYTRRPCGIHSAKHSFAANRKK